MKNLKVEQRIKALVTLINEKSNELRELKQELSELENSLKYSDIRFVIKCSNSSFRLANQTRPNDILIDAYTGANGNIYSRSSKERREYARSIFEDYLKNGKQCTICTCSDEALNTIGSLICENNIIPNQIEVLMFSDEYPKGKVTHFTREGYLTDWEIGFLS